ncbi:coiled-coil domain containing 121 [Rhinolophus ferrumequinum]|uniref:Coiled-coil domain containing 121 n=1 Tax=Rhinolophus ferrumequinum TaxID=59479 RepID=A0A7J7V7A3_RHIFE|nr:coiled-coil domain containing 121 [Rhinolophus ferrumequinum]
MAGKCRVWEEDWSGPEKLELMVVGLGLGRAKLWFPWKQEDLGSQGQDPHTTKKRVRFTFRPPGAGNTAYRETKAKVYSAEVKQPRAGPARTGYLRGCWAAPRPVEHRTEKLRKVSSAGRCIRVSQSPDTSSLAVTLNELQLDLGEKRWDSSRKFVEDSSGPPPPYLSLINNFFEPEKLTMALMGLKETTVEMMTLDKQIKQAQIWQEPLMKETWQLLSEKLHVQAENKFFLEYLTNKTERYRRQFEKLWNSYLQRSGETEQRRQESASKYAKQTSELNTELLQKGKIQSDLNQQLQALRDVSLLKEKQERAMQTLEEEKRKVQAETTGKKQEIQVQYLQEKALLEKQLSEPDVRQLGKRKGKKLNRKIQALELAAENYTFELYRSVRRENQQLQKELLQQTWQCQKLQTTQRQFKTQKRQLQQEQWYVEGLIRGRQRLQGMRQKQEPLP